MPRVHVAIDETNVNAPKISLHVCGHDCILSEEELNSLIADAMWAANTIGQYRINHYHHLIKEYERMQHATA